MILSLKIVPQKTIFMNKNGRFLSEGKSSNLLSVSESQTEMKFVFLSEPLTTDHYVAHRTSKMGERNDERLLLHFLVCIFLKRIISK